MISKGTHINFSHFVLLAIREGQKIASFHLMYNKAIIRFGVCDIQNNQGLGKGYQPQPLADNPYLDLHYSCYHKNLIQKLFIICTHYSTFNSLIYVLLFISFIYSFIFS